MEGRESPAPRKGTGRELRILHSIILSTYNQDINNQNINKQDINKQNINKQNINKQNINKQNINKQNINSWKLIFGKLALKKLRLRIKQRVDTYDRADNHGILANDTRLPPQPLRSRLRGWKTY